MQEAENTRPKSVSIPRLERRDEPPRKQARSRLDRVPRACLSCRARKIRCNGEQPSCKHCRDSESQCIYASSRKDRLKVATEHNEEMLQFLKSLRADVGDVERMKIDQLLADVAADVADAAAAIQKSPSKLRNTEGEPDAELEEGEANISAEVGSNEDLDNMNEDILRNEQSRATGYVGKNSEVQWLRQLNHEAVTAASHGKDVYRGPYGPPGSNARAWADREAALRQRQMQDPVPQVPTSNFNFNLDGETIDMDFMVDPFDLPPLETADRLVRCYMDTVHKTFPILPKKTFVNQFYHYYAALAQGQPYQLPRKWQAMLNLVFAIGAVFSHLTDAEWRADERDHFIYHSRAWALSLKDPWWFSDPDLPQTQITALLAFYYLAIGHTNRSWIVVGMAVRSSFSLGLHVRNEDRTATAVKKEILARIWWGVYTLERLLSVITGRPSVGIESQCSVYLPLPISCDDFEEARIQALFGTRPRPTTADDSTVSEASSASSSRGFDSPLNSRGPANSGTYLTSTVKLGKISQRILTEIYSPSVIKRSWKDVQRIITEIMEDLERWAASLPTGLDVLSHDRGDQPMTYERRNLTVYYHSTKILMTRPCLCRLDRRIPNQSQGSNDFNHRMATICVSSAKSLAALLPDDMVNERSRIYEIFPWWTAVHYIMQSLAILMFDLSDKGPPASGGNNTVAVLKKLVRWLRALRSTNGMARRAHSIILNLLQKMVVSIPIVSNIQSVRPFSQCCHRT
ncbi:hypothetical protein CC80DRAFT_191676 [Byssothecium circinans]|uniref:Zn(2)-C6 fungal-type domain-containing protein n=1 Tax=Byssothecium circinans TaxID=147558 RepID=A0A6A5TRW7_9PLEO|nr:hypothetical protein CC80DRAFT_191676 [Byssothecium circinans]